MSKGSVTCSKCKEALIFLLPYCLPIIGSEREGKGCDGVDYSSHQLS